MKGSLILSFIDNFQGHVTFLINFSYIRASWIELVISEKWIYSTHLNFLSDNAWCFYAKDKRWYFRSCEWKAIYYWSSIPEQGELR